MAVSAAVASMRHFVCVFTVPLMLWPCECVDPRATDCRNRTTSTVTLLRVGPRDRLRPVGGYATFLHQLPGHWIPATSGNDGLYTHAYTRYYYYLFRTVTRRLDNKRTGWCQLKITVYTRLALCAGDVSSSTRVREDRTRQIWSRRNRLGSLRFDYRLSYSIYNKGAIVGNRPVSAHAVESQYTRHLSFTTIAS